MRDWLLYGIPLALVSAAVVTDLRRREVSDYVPLSILGWAVIAKLLGLSPLSWTAMIVGPLLGLMISGPFYALKGVAAGDVLLVAALGAVLGPIMLLKMLFWMALAGGVLAVAAALRGAKDLAYVPAIAAGLVVQTVWPNALGGLLAAWR